MGGTLLFTLLIGWIFNLGHRLRVVHRLAHGEQPYSCGFRPWGVTFRWGLTAFAAIVLYLSPATILAGVALISWSSGHVTVSLIFAILGALFFLVALFALPGGMTYNAAFNDISYLYRPDRALCRALAGGTAYLRAWAVALLAILLSFLGLLLFGIGYFYTSVWAWSVVGYAFSRALVLAGPEAARTATESNRALRQ